MNVSQSQAENAVSISALITGGMYAYRYFTEGETSSVQGRTSGSFITAYKGVYGFGPVLPLGQWVPAAGVTYLAISIMASANPEFGTAVAVLVGVGAFFGNVLAIQKDLANKPSTSKLSIATAKKEGQKAAPEPSKNQPHAAINELPTLVEGGL